MSLTLPSIGGYLSNRILLIFCCLLSLSATASPATKSSYQLIQSAYDAGRLSTEEKLILEVQSVKNQSLLPVEYRSTIIETGKCATEILLEATRSYSGLSLGSQQELRQLLTRPTNTYSFDSPGGKFKIHYSTTGANAVPTADANANGVPDYVEWLASYADSSYQAEVINLAQLEPPSDGTLGGDGRYDIYTEEMGYYGYTQYEGPGPNPWNDGYSYISVHRNFIGFPPNDDPDGLQKGAAKVTIAHEYYHAVQFAYNYAEESWLMESSSTWMEDFVYDPVNDNYNYLSDWFGYPDYALNSTAGLHAYASFVWPKYLTQNFTANFMPQLWNNCKFNNAYPALTATLTALGTNLSTQFAQFCVWNFITGSRADDQHYRDATRYPLITTVRTHTTYPVSGQGPVSGKFPDALGANYVIFNLPGGAGQFTITFNGDNSTPWVVTILGWKAGTNDQYIQYPMTLDGSGDGSFTMTNPTDFTSAVMVVSNVSQTLNDRSYTYGASFVAGPQIAVLVNAMADDSVYSNTITHIRFQVNNTGAVPDIFYITFGDRLGWSLFPTASQVSLAAGASQQVSLTATCPPLTAGGIKDTVFLTATSSSLGSVSSVDSATALVFLKHGDADNSGSLDISDPVYIIGYIFSSGAAPAPALAAGDFNCDGFVDVSDCVGLIEYIFSSGPPPPCNPF
jgi:hypothetical protein